MQGEACTWTACRARNHATLLAHRVAAACCGSTPCPATRRSLVCHAPLAQIKTSLPKALFEGPPGAPPPPGAALTLSAAGVEGDVRVPFALEGTPELRLERK
jgi:hypothetical protein